MSGSMSKTEIEDVLSSIRRLVTEEQFQQQRPVARSSDKLVLTPALRIDPVLSDVRQPSQGAEPLSLGAEQKVDLAASAAHQAAAALEAALMGHRDDWEPEGTEPVPSLRSNIDWDFPEGDDATDMTGPASPAPADEDLADHRPILAEAPILAEPPIPAEPPILAEAPVPVEAPILAEAPAAMAVDSAPEDDIYWDEYLAVHRSTPLLAAEQAESWHPVPDPVAEPPADLSGSSGFADAPHDQPVAATGPEPAPEAEGLPQPLSAPPAQALDATGQGDGDPPAALLSDRRAEAAVFDRPLDDGPTGAAQQDAATGTDDAQLRDLIRDVLREELQGDLGQRITRNIRKLVRAELARALTVRDLT
ncbi:MAG: hypothetical protein INF52_15430 [Rhodobacter sp.]|nr:hypothetical protein [Rhodobacter sp.]